MRNRHISKVVMFFIVLSVILSIFFLIPDIYGNNSYDNTYFATLIESKDKIKTKIEMYKSDVMLKEPYPLSDEDILIKNSKYSIADEYNEEIIVDGKEMYLYKVNEEKYNKNISDTMLFKDEFMDNLYIDEKGNVYFVFDNYSLLPNSIKRILKSNQENQIKLINSFVIVKNNEVW